MHETQSQSKTCIPKETISKGSAISRFVLPEAPRLSAARFEGSCVSRHVHQYFEIVYIESGNGVHGIGEHLVPAAAGDIFLIAPGEVHDTHGLENASKWVVAFGADSLNAAHTDAVAFIMPTDMLLLLAFFRPIGVQTEHFHLPPTDRARWVERLHLLESELRHQQLGYADSARALLVLLLTDIARIAFSHEDTPALPSRLLFARVFRHIEAHFREPVSLRDVAALVGHAPAYLTDLVRRETGRTVLEWIIERRMAEARYLLRETEQTVQSVADAVGYRHVGHFNTHFKRLHGLPPQTWRYSQMSGITPKESIGAPKDRV